MKFVYVNPIQLKSFQQKNNLTWKLSKMNMA